jgi:hypothetical protein
MDTRFALKEQPVKFSHLNTRTEGGDNKGAFDMKIVAHLPKEMLDVICRGLCAETYKDETVNDMVGGKNFVLRHPEINYPIGIDYELVGAGVLIHLGVETILKIDSAKINNISIKPMTGGTVETTLRIQVVGHSDVHSYLYEHQKSDITISIEPPALAEMPESE